MRLHSVSSAGSSLSDKTKRFIAWEFNKFACWHMALSQIHECTGSYAVYLYNRLGAGAKGKPNRANEQLGRHGLAIGMFGCSAQ